jgi:hypothetical protein
MAQAVEPITTSRRGVLTGAAALATAAAVPIVGTVDDPALRTIKAFYAAEDDFVKCAGGADDETCVQLHGEILHPAWDAMKSLPAATTAAGAIAALECALYEMDGGIGYEAWCVRSALEYLQNLNT